MTEGSGNKPQKSLGKQAFGAVIWAALGRVGRAGAQIVFMLYLGAAIGPEGFAAASIALIGYQLISTVAAQSFSMALVRYADEHAGREAAAFWLNILLCLFLTLVIWALSAPLAQALSLPSIEWLLPLVSALALTGAPTVIVQGRMSRQMQFKRIAQIETVSSAGAAAAGVAAIYMDMGIAALAVYAGAQRIIETIGFMARRGAFPTRLPDGKSVPELLRFTLPLAASQILVMLNTSVDQFFVGRAANPESLGFYSFGRRMTRQPAQMLNFAIGRAIFPSLVRARETEEGQGKLALASLRLSILLSAIPLFLLAAVAEDFVLLTVGEEWLPSARYVALFAIISTMLPLGAVFNALLRAEGRTIQQLLFKLLRLVVISIVLGIMTHQGASVWSLAIATAIVSVLSFLPPLIESAYALKMPVLRIFKAMALGFFPPTAMLVLLWLLQLTPMADLHALVRFILTSVIGLGLAGLFSYPQMRELIRARRKKA